MISSRLRNLIEIAKKLPISTQIKPSVQLVNELRQSFEQITLEDLQLDAKTDLTASKIIHLNPAYKTAYGQPIAYYPLLEDPRFTLSIFAMPKGSSIPLHSHPQMQILSKMLYGAITVDSFQQYNPHELSSSLSSISQSSSASQSKIQQLHASLPSPATATTPTSIEVLYCGRHVMNRENCTSHLSPPSILHRFRSIESSSAVLELLFPPYRPPFRNCTYYKESSVPTAEGKVVLSPFEPDFYCLNDEDHQGLLELNNLLKQLYTTNNINNNNNNSNNNNNNNI